MDMQKIISESLKKDIDYLDELLNYKQNNIDEYLILEKYLNNKNMFIIEKDDFYYEFFNNKTKNEMKKRKKEIYNQLNVIGFEMDHPLKDNNLQRLKNEVENKLSRGFQILNIDKKESYPSVDFFVFKNKKNIEEKLKELKIEQENNFKKNKNKEIDFKINKKNKSYKK